LRGESAIFFSVISEFDDAISIRLASLQPPNTNLAHLTP